MAYPYSVNMAVSRTAASVFPQIRYIASGTPVNLSSANAKVTFLNVSTGVVDLTLTLGDGVALSADGVIQVALSSLHAAQLASDQYEYYLELDMG